MKILDKDSHNIHDFAVKISENRIETLRKYQQIICNAPFNLISSNDKKVFWDRHIIDSLALIKVSEYLNIDTHDLNIADIGSGGGLPTIPCAAVRTDWRFYPIESVKKKADFISETSKELKLNNVQVIHDRWENTWREFIQMPNLLIVFRAVNPSDILKTIKRSGELEYKKIVYFGTTSQLNSNFGMKYEVFPYISDTKRVLFLFD